MAIVHPGNGPRWRPDVRRRFVAATAVLALLAPDFAPGLALAGNGPVAASAVPLPRLNPLKSTAPSVQIAEAGDPIGALIAEGGDAAERAATEDSDAPETASPDVQLPPLAPPSPTQKKQPFSAAGLKQALKRLDANDPAGATLSAYALPNRVDIKLVDWLIATGGYHDVSSSAILTLQKKLSGWPSQSLMRARYEQALARENPSPAAVIAALGGRNLASDDGRLLLADAYVATGKKGAAAAIVRDLWRTRNLSNSVEKQILKDFSGLIRASDDKWRMDRFFYLERTRDALQASKRLSKSQQALAKAVTLVTRQSSKGAKALAALPRSVKSDPLYLFARVKVLRRADKNVSAAKLLASAPRDPKALVDPDAWWVERRLVSRQLIEDGNPKLAYAVAAGHMAESSSLRAEAEFHAGWYALEFLHDPQTASRHFANIEAISKLPLSSSRADYWMGRAAEAAGDMAGAMAHYRDAAGYPTAFYGQLAIARLGGKTLPLSRPPAPTNATVAHFESLEMVQAIRHLFAVDEDNQTGVFFRQLAETLTDPAEITLLARLADDNDQHSFSLQVGKIAARRGLPVDTLAFPIAAIPSKAKTPNVERPLVYAIARQESAFNARAISGAGARGLLQLMPATAKQTARSLGLKYSKSRLTSDPAYNATLGAAHLGLLVDNFGGSYVMTFAGYNAGGSRVRQWIERYGDPRDPKVDVVNWIELIPFTETRNYVQRIMENLQVYRARLGAGPLRIEADLKRGGPSGQ